MSSTSFGLDLSYLTLDERRIIDDVIRRQKEEEDRNAVILRGLQDDYHRIAQAVRHRLAADKCDPIHQSDAIPNGSSNCFTGSYTDELASMCQICRTHIPDIPVEGIRLAHCHYCGLRVCYRCGTTLTYKAKTVWTCALCKKRHELLVKTGQWAAVSEFDAGFTAASRRAHSRSRSQEPRSLVITSPQNVSRVVRGQIVALPGQPLDLRRHVSSSSAQMDTDGGWNSDGATYSSPKAYSPSMPQPATVTNLVPEGSWQNFQVAENLRPNSTLSFNQNTAGFVTSTADKVSMASNVPLQGSLRAAQSLPRLTSGNSHLHSQFPNMDNGMTHNCSEIGFCGSASPIIKDPLGSQTVLVANGRTTSSSSVSHTPTPVFSVGGRSTLRRSRMSSMVHQDSLSSDPSSDFGGGVAHSSSSTSYINTIGNVPPFPSHNSRSSLANRRSCYSQFPQASISSSEDDMRSTPDYLTESDLEFEVESGSVSERGDLDSYRSGAESGGEGWRPYTFQRFVPASNGTLPLGAISGSGVVDPLTCGAFGTLRGSPSNGMSNRTKAVRFQRNSSVDLTSNDRGHAVGPGARDSGVETASSTQTLNEDGSKFRMDWQRSFDGSKLIGKFSILRNNRGESSSRILGLKVVGGRLADNGQLGALITKVKRGSVADTVGRLRPGDEVVEWNGVPLQGLTFEQVYEVISSTRDCRRLEMLVHRSMLGCVSDEPERMDAPPRASRRHSVAFPPASIPLSAQASQPETDLDAGRLQLRLWLDTAQSELAVTVVSARDLLPVGLAAATTEPPPQAFSVVSLLPVDPAAGLITGDAILNGMKDIPAPTRRWTNRHPPSWEPRWDQLFSMWPVASASHAALDIAVYDGQPPDGCCDSDSSLVRCIGFVILMLNEVPLNNEPYWYRLARPEPGSRPGPGIIPPMMDQQGMAQQETAPTVPPKSQIRPVSKTLQRQSSQKSQSSSWQKSPQPLQRQQSWQQPPPQEQQQQTWQQQAPVVPQQQQQMQPQILPEQQMQRAPIPQQLPDQYSGVSQYETQSYLPQQQQPQYFAEQQQQGLVPRMDQQPQSQYFAQPQQQQGLVSQVDQQQQLYQQQPQLQPQPQQQQYWNAPDSSAAFQQPGQIAAAVTVHQQPAYGHVGSDNVYIMQQPVTTVPQPVSSYSSFQMQQPQQQQQQQAVTNAFSTEYSQAPSLNIPQQELSYTTLAPVQQQQQQVFNVVDPALTVPPPGPAPILPQPTPALPVSKPPVSITTSSLTPTPLSSLQPTSQALKTPATVSSALPPVPSSILHSEKPPETIVPVVKDLPPSIIKTSLPSNQIPDAKVAAAESEPEFGDDNESQLDAHGRLYRKHSQIGISATQGSSSLTRRVARHRSDTSSISSNATPGTAPSDVLQEPVQPPEPPIEQPTETPPAKRHVRLAPEVSFIVGNDEPPIQMPLASSASSDASSDRLAASAKGGDTSERSTPNTSRRPSITGAASAPVLPRAISVADTASDAESVGSGVAMSGNEMSDIGESSSHKYKSQLSFSESEAGGRDMSGGEHNDGNISDGAVSGGKSHRKSLWPTAAKKSLLKMTGKSAFPNVVDSVMQQNLTKQKKKTGISRCGDEVVTQASSASGGGFDMSAGFFDGDLGPGQVVGRQMLGATAIGELEIGLREDSSGHLTITLVAARDLVFKNKAAPSIYAKAALVVGQSTQERQKSVPQQVRDADPQLGIEFAFQSTPFRDKMLQVSLWAAYGRMAGRHCLGAVAIKLEQIGKFPLRAAYRLYDPAAVGGFVASIATEGPAVALI